MDDKDSLIRALERDLPGWMLARKVPGVSIALIIDGVPAWQRGFGVRDAVSGAPVGVDTIFEAASLTKPVFARGVLQLIDSRALDLDAPLAAYLPEPYLDDPRLPLITARHVLSHTCGFPNWQKKDQPLRVGFTPGERFTYSGEGYVYLQRVVERVTGQPLGDLMAARVLAPLGMPDSSFTWRAAYETQAATGHDPDGAPAEKDRPAEANAAYTLHTTPAEYARFVCACLRPPDPDAPRRRDDMRADMLRWHVPVNSGSWGDGWPDAPYAVNERVGWGLGWGLQRAGGEDMLWHWGDNSAFQAFVMASRQRQLGFVAMANSESGRSLWQDIARRVFGADQPAIEWVTGLY